MYINDVNILFYVVAAVIGGLVGNFVNWMNVRLPEYKKVFSKDYLKKENRPKVSYVLIIIMAVAYVALLYFFGIGEDFYANLDLIKYAFLIPALLSALIIDYKLQIIPNRLNLTIFEVGLLLTFIYGIANLNIAINMLLGMITGAGIFFIITLIGGLIAGKEAMGFGDVKLMGALGLFFGFAGIIAISLIAFLLGAVISIILIATKKKKTDEYIPFGPFIVLAAFIVIFVPFSSIVKILLQIFTLGMHGRLNN